MDDDYKMEGCRTCGVFSPLQYNFLRPLFGKHSEPKMQDMIEMLNTWHLEIQENDGMPQYICTQCLLQISQIYEFHRSCIDAQKQLRQWYFKENISVKIKVEKDDEEDVAEKEPNYIYIDDCNDHAMQLNNSSKTDELLLFNQAEIIDETVNTTYSEASHSSASIPEGDFLTNKQDLEDVSILGRSNNICVQRNVNKKENTGCVNDILRKENNNNKELIQLERNQDQLTQNHSDVMYKEDFDDHKVRLTSKKLHKCTFCAFECNTSQQLKKHKASLHSKNQTKRPLCPQRSKQSLPKRARHDGSYNNYTNVLRKEVNSTIIEEVEETAVMDVDTAEFVSITFCTDDGELINGTESQTLRIYSAQNNCLDVEDKDQASFNKSKFQCHVCNKSFGLQFNLNRHLERHKPTLC